MLNLLVACYVFIIVGFVSVAADGSPNLTCHEVIGADGKHEVSLCPIAKRSRDEVCSKHDTWVSITVNATLDKEEARKLQVVWHVPKVHLGDVIKLYKSSKSAEQEPIFEVVPYARYGLSDTHIYETYINVQHKFEPICLGYYVVYLRKSEVLSSSCLQTNPTWMRFYNFGQMRLWDMFIPGTHDSSAYHTAYRPEDTGRLDNYVFTQEEDILEQLVHGARSLDLRVGKTKDTFFAHHGVARLYPFQEVITDIITFIERTHEILILDFHHFPVGFHDDRDHMEFFDYMYSQLGPYMVPPHLGWNATLEDIWATEKYLIVSFNHLTTFESKKDILWPPITHMWGNVQNITALYDYLVSTFDRPPKEMWSAQAQLTPTPTDIVINNLGGLRKMAQQTNTQVSKWFRGRWGKKCHIVTADFIRSSSIVDVAIDWNLQKTYSPPCPLKRKTMKEWKREVKENILKNAKKLKTIQRKTLKKK